MNENEAKQEEKPIAEKETKPKTEVIEEKPDAAATSVQDQEETKEGEDEGESILYVIIKII